MILLLIMIMKILMCVLINESIIIIIINVLMCVCINVMCENDINV